jgi:hypothetical protein
MSVIRPDQVFYYFAKTLWTGIFNNFFFNGFGNKFPEQEEKQNGEWYCSQKYTLPSGKKDHCAPSTKPMALPP